MPPLAPHRPSGAGAPAAARTTATARTAAAARAAARAALLFLTLIVLIVAAPTVAHAADAPVQVQAQLEPHILGLDDTATLVITAQGGGFSSLSFRPKFTLDNLEVAAGESQFEDINLTNGSLSRSFRFAVPLRPMAIGIAHVRNLEITVRGELKRLPDLEIKVQEQPAANPPGAPGSGAATGSAAPGVPGARGSDRRVMPFPGRPATPMTPQDIFDRFFGRGRQLPGQESPQQQAQSPIVFLRAEVQPPSPVVGQQAIYTVYLYARQDTAAQSYAALPTFQGFWVRDIPQPEHLVPEYSVINGERYGRVALLRKALFALRPGPHTLESAACDVVVEPMVRSFFGPTLSRPEEVHLRTGPVAVEVRPLPAAAPPGFNGVVGQVNLTAQLQPYTLVPGQAATLTVTLAGTGNLQGVTAPELDLPAGITAFPPQQQSDDRLQGTTVTGRRTWTYILLAQKPGHYDVRPRPVHYFDPAAGSYRAAQSPALGLTALPPPPTVHPPAPPPATPLPAARARSLFGPAAVAALAGMLRRAVAGANRDAGLLMALAAGLAFLLGVAFVAGRRYRHKPSGAGSGVGVAGSAAGADTGAPPSSSPGVPWPGTALQGASSQGGTPPGANSPSTASTPSVPTGFPMSAAGAAAATAAVAARNGNGKAQIADLEQKLKEAAREDRPRQAATLVEEGWRGLLAARWGVPVTTPPPRWSAALAAHGAAPEIAGEMLHLIEDLHYLRYAPQLSTTSAVRDEVLSRSRQLLRRLR